MKGSPTLTSFYTLAEKGRGPIKPAPEGPSGKITPSSPRLTIPWIINRSIDPTPYVCLASRLTQVPFNIVTVGFILLAVFVHFFASGVLYSLDVAKSGTLSSCISSTSDDIAASSFPETVSQSILKDIERNIVILTEQADENLDSSLDIFGTTAVTYIDVLSDVYTDFAKSVAQSSYKAANNVSRSVTEWANDTLGDAIYETDKEINNVTESLKTLQRDLSSSSLFTKVDLGSAQNLNLNRFKSIRFPKSINSTLAKLNKGDGSKFHSISSDAKKIVNTWMRKAKGANSTSYNKKSLMESVGPIKPHKVDLCPGIGNDVQSHFRDLSNSIKGIKRNCIASCVVLAISFILLRAVYEYYRWRRTLEQAAALETPGGFLDPIDNVNTAESPISSKIGYSLALFICGRTTEKFRVSLRWFVDYISTSTALGLLFVGGWFLVAFVCQMAVVNPIVSSNKFNDTVIPSSSMPASYNSTVGSWVDRLNSVVKDTEESTNNGIFSHLKKSLDEIQKDLNTYQNSMASEMRNFFGDYQDSLSIPQTLTDKVITPTNVMISPLKFPRLNTSDVPTVNIVSGEIDLSKQLEDLSSTLASTTTITMQISVSFLSFWAFIVIVSLLYSLVTTHFIVFSGG